MAVKNVLLIDDIYTTGSTVNQCARVLKAGGVARVYVFTLASGRDI
ncbi:MAG: phosphoribosyltransferase family protein [Bacillota bacterium]